VKLTQILLLSLLPFLVVGCKGSTGSVKPETSMLRSCALPASLPDRDLTQAEVERFWIRDRQNLINCGVSKKALVNWLKRNGKI